MQQRSWISSITTFVFFVVEWLLWHYNARQPNSCAAINYWHTKSCLLKKPRHNYYLHDHERVSECPMEQFIAIIISEPILMQLLSCNVTTWRGFPSLAEDLRSSILCSLYYYGWYKSFIFFKKIKEIEFFLLFFSTFFGRRVVQCITVNILLIEWRFK